MNLRNRLIVLVILLIFAFLSLSNPSEKTYLSRVSDDYKQYHLNMDIPVEVLQEIGKSNRSTYLLSARTIIGLAMSGYFILVWPTGFIT